MIAPAPTLALFDLDHTLLDGDSNQEWLAFLAAEGVADARVLARQDAFFADYQAGRLDMGAYLEFQVSLLVDRSAAQLADWQHRFAERHLAPRIGAAARAAVRRHQHAGHLVAIVSATQAFVAAPSAALLGVEHLVATRPEMRDGRYTGRVPRPWCFREGKIACVDAWLAGLGQQRSGFAAIHVYSDSFNDLPLLQMASHPVAVNADPRLARWAAEHGWAQQHIRCDTPLPACA